MIELEKIFKTMALLNLFILFVYKNRGGFSTSMLLFCFSLSNQVLFNQELIPNYQPIHL